jgi:hypothetical protein
LSWSWSNECTASCWQRDLDGLQQRFEDLVASLYALLHLLHPRQPRAQVGLELVDRVELAGELGEVVVGLGQLTHLHRLHGDGDIGFLARVLAREQGRREVLGLTDRRAEQGIVDAVDQLAGADLVGQAARPGLLDVLAVDRGRQVDGHEVAGLDRAVGAGQRAEPGAQLIKLLINLGVGKLHVVDRHREVAIGGDGEVGADVDLGGEREVVAVFELGDLDVGLTERLDLGGGERLHVLGRNGLVDDLVENRRATDARLDDPGGCLAGAEARNADLARELAVGAVEVRLELVERHLDVDPYPRRAQVLDGALQRDLLDTDIG